MAYIETYRAVVAPSDCDHLGHMNVSGYFQACSDAVIAFQAQLGLTPADVLKGRKLSFAVVRAESDFKSEVSAGDVLTMQPWGLAFTTVPHPGIHPLDFCARMT